MSLPTELEHSGVATPWILLENRSFSVAPSELPRYSGSVPEQFCMGIRNLVFLGLDISTPLRLMFVTSPVPSTEHRRARQR